jgi:hypothetical protein
MASNSDLFGTALMRYHEKQLYRKFLDVMEILPLGHVDYELKLYLKFYARFLALYTSKMKREWVNSYWKKRLIKNEDEYKKIIKMVEKQPEVYEPVYEYETEYYKNKWQR